MSWSIGDAPYPGVRGAHGARYRVGPLCAVPTCGRIADAAHHIWSRSYMGKPWDWILVEGVVVPNLLPLCWDHHEEVTGQIGGYKAGIRYDPESGCLFWTDHTSEVELVWGTSQNADPYVRDDPELCSECGRRKPRKVPEGVSKGPKRPKARVVFTVPKDEREDGEAIVREHLSNCAELLGRSEDESYYTLVEALAWFAWNYHPDAEEYTGEGPCPTCGTTPETPERKEEPCLGSGRSSQRAMPSRLSN